MVLPKGKARVITQSLIAESCAEVPSLQRVPRASPPPPGMSFDPAVVPLAPELAARVFGWVRRLALQAELGAADRLLRDALAELTESLSILILYVGPEGWYSVDSRDQLPPDRSGFDLAASMKRAVVQPYRAYVPIIVAGQPLAVIELARNTHQRPFDSVACMMMAALVRESATIVHHLIAEHRRRALEHAADKKSLYRPEALENHRRRGQDGVLTELSPGWVRAAYYILIDRKSVV